MSHRRLKLLVAVCAALIGSASAGVATEVRPDVPTEAIWQFQEFDFYFSGVKGHYHSCSSLHDKIRGFMEAIGAGSVVVRLACHESALVDNTFAHIATAMPIQATPENVRAATTFGTEHQLIARLRGAPLPTAATLERFPTEWRKVAVTKMRGVRLGPEDCDLLHDLHEQILPRLASVRVIRKSFACGGNNLQYARPILVVEALLRRAA